jgi:hypothetical protein
VPEVDVVERPADGFLGANIGPGRKALLAQLAAMHDRSISAEVRRAIDAYAAAILRSPIPPRIPEQPMS